MLDEPLDGLAQDFPAEEKTKYAAPISIACLAPQPPRLPSESLLNVFQTPAAPSKMPSWANMPQKTQLFVLFLSRFADFFQMACLQAIMFHQLRSFDPEAADAKISKQAGILTGVFTSAQIVTGLLWGRVADYPQMGRKRVLVLGFVGTAISCIGIAFSRSFGAVVAWRCVGGGINGTVGAARTMLAESVPKSYHSRAFLILPLAFNVAQIFGPILGGAMADPVKLYPQLFGPSTILGGKDGVMWMQSFPYAAPNLLSAFVCLLEALLIYVMAFETLEARKHVRDRGAEFGQSIYHFLTRPFGKQYAYSKLDGDIESPTANIEMDRQALAEKMSAKPKTRQILPFSRIWTKNLLFTLLSIALFDFHMGAFTSLWLIFLSTARTLEAPKSIVLFSGGLSFPPPTIGWAMSILGFIGIALQLTLYPRISSRLGLVRSFQYSLALFPLAYFLTPYLARIPCTTEAPAPASGIFLWMGIATVLFLQVAARTFALPASILLLNNSSPHPSVLATVHGLGSSTSAAFRTIGPMVAGHWFADGIRSGMVGWAWWMVALVAFAGFVASWWVKNGSGHQILLEGEKREGVEPARPRN